MMLKFFGISVLPLNGLYDTVTTTPRSCFKENVTCMHVYLYKKGK